VYRGLELAVVLELVWQRLGPPRLEPERHHRPRVRREAQALDPRAGAGQVQRPPGHRQAQGHHAVAPPEHLVVEEHRHPLLPQDGPHLVPRRQEVVPNAALAAAGPLPAFGSSEARPRGEAQSERGEGVGNQVGYHFVEVVPSVLNDFIHTEDILGRHQHKEAEEAADHGRRGARPEGADSWVLEELGVRRAPRHEERREQPGESDGPVLAREVLGQVKDPRVIHRLVHEG